MARATIAHRYYSEDNGRVYGPWEPGDEVELTADELARIERDSPGVIANVKADAEAMVETTERGLHTTGVEAISVEVDPTATSELSEETMKAATAAALDAAEEAVETVVHDAAKPKTPRRRKGPSDG